MKFQSSPAPKGECYGLIPYSSATHTLFQSSPAPKGECYAQVPLG